MTTAILQQNQQEIFFVTILILITHKLLFFSKL